MPCPGSAGPRPGFIPAANTAQARLLFTQHGQQMENVLYFKGAADWTAENLAALGEVIRTWANDDLMPIVASDVTLQAIHLTDMESATGPVAEVVANIDGSGDGPGMPGNVTLAIKFVTALRGRSYRGRAYFVGLPASQVSGDTVDPDYVALILTAFATLRDAVPDVNTGALAIASYQQDCEWLEAAVVTPVVNEVSDGIVDSQRRRLTGRGA